MLSSEKGEVAFVDTTGSFSPLRLRNVLASRLESQYRSSEYHQVGYVSESTQPISAARDEPLNEQADRLLDRVKVMRVFDLAGVIEALEEVGQMLEKRDERLRNVGDMHLEDGKREVNDSEDNVYVGCVEINVHDEQLTERTSNAHDDQVGMFIVDTITNVVSSIVSRNQVQGSYNIKRLQNLRILLNLIKVKHFWQALCGLFVI